MSDEWLRCGEVLDAIQPHYTGRHAELDAAKALLDRLAAKTMLARGRVIIMEGAIKDAQLVLNPPDQVVVIPDRFWVAIQQHTRTFPSLTAKYHGDWKAGDFELESLRSEPSDEAYFRAVIQDVYLQNNGIPNIDSIGHQAKGPPNRGGRKAASWWADFAEELVIYFHECGYPDGSGTEGQSEVIDEICRRLAEQGKVEPSRTTIQPVINAILKRFRSTQS
jgi:hypothetical protein